MGNGFHIVDAVEFQAVEVENYHSAACTFKDKVEAQILKEVTEGRYVLVQEKPAVVSALGAIAKPNGGVRLIHDGSRPTGLALNDYASLDQQLRFQSLGDAVEVLEQGMFLAKVDLQSAYRSVRIHPSNWQACGLKWQFNTDRFHTYFVDTALPFGSRLAPSIFNRLTQSVRRMMAQKGFHQVIAYLDDFLIIERTYDKCLNALNTLLSLLRDLGFSIAWDKLEGPAQAVVFLGVNIDTVRGCLELPPEKLKSFRLLIRDTLELKRISLKQLQVLAGKLNWAAAVVRGGRIYLRRVLEMMKPLYASHHKALIPHTMKQDLLWWDMFLETFNGTHWLHPTTHWVNVYTDASRRGGGMVWGSDWQFIDWEHDVPEARTAHINVKETLAIGLAVRRWAPFWRNASVVVHTDNITARCAINKGKAKSTLSMAMVREIFWWSTIFNFKIRAVHIPGEENIVADAVSRLHVQKFYDLLVPFWSLHPHSLRFLWPVFFLQHMSYGAFLSVCLQMIRWLNTSTYWTVRLRD